MIVNAARYPYVCARCLSVRAACSSPLSVRVRRRASVSARRYANSAVQRKEELDDDRQEQGAGESEAVEVKKLKRNVEHEGAMTRRLRDMSEEALESGSRSTQKAVLEAEFSPELKAQLEERISTANFRADHRSAFAEAELPSHASRHTRDIATAEPWAGTESIHDASLRMLNDAHKPLKLGKGTRVPGLSAQPPKSIDTGRKSARGGAAAAGTRLANARDRSGMYVSLKEGDLDVVEREKRFQELKDRFNPHARAVVPGTIQGLSSLANERIEDAIARGQFKNLPRGKGKHTERDYNASNPFLDTTEYFMNKIIQKQEIVPPWIEKQQELVAAASKFRSRLRNDWKRHAARVIASKGGTLQDQIKRAEAYAKAELIANPRKKKEVLTTVDDEGHLSQISLSGGLKMPSPSESSGLDTATRPIAEEIVAERTTLSSTSLSDADEFIKPSPAPRETSIQTISLPLDTPPPSTTVPPAPYPFRDPDWENTELAYHNVAINDLNSKTRSYNLQAPDLAKKPYFNLQRELNACYADIAPQIAEAIRERARKPVKKLEGFGDHLAGDKSVLDRFMGEKARVRDERAERQYGFKQFWRDLWTSEQKV